VAKKAFRLREIQKQRANGAQMRTRNDGARARRERAKRPRRAARRHEPI